MGFSLEGLPLNKRWLCGGQPNLRCDSVRTSESEQLVPAAAAAQLTVIIIIVVNIIVNIIIIVVNIIVNIIIGYCWIVGVIVVNPCLFHRQSKMAKDFRFISIGKYLNSSWVAQLQLPPRQLYQCTTEVFSPNEFLVKEGSYFQTKPLKARMCDRDGSIWTTWSLLGFSQRKTTSSCNGRFKSRCWQCQMKSYSAMLAVSPSSS